MTRIGSDPAFVRLTGEGAIDRFETSILWTDTSDLTELSRLMIDAVNKIYQALGSRPEVGQVTVNHPVGGSIPPSPATTTPPEDTL